MKLAHTRGGALVQIFNDQTGFMRMEDGRRTDISKIETIPWQLGNDMLVPYVEEIQDTSTQARVVRTDTGPQVEADRVYRLITIRDKTQEELDADLEKAVTQELAQNFGKIFYRIANEIQALKGLQPLTPAQFKIWYKNNVNIQ